MIKQYRVVYAINMRRRDPLPLIIFFINDINKRGTHYCIVDSLESRGNARFLRGL